jgi:hypothetical protein
MGKRTRKRNRLGNGGDSVRAGRRASAPILAHKVSSDLKFRFVLLNRIGEVLSYDKPI